MKLMSLLAAGVFATAVSAHAQTTTLLDLVNPGTNGHAEYALSFTATSAFTTLSDGGYQLPGAAWFTYNSVTGASGGGNLLNTLWTYTPSSQAASAFGALQVSDTTGVNALGFQGATVGGYDTFSQTFATKVGETYTYSFVLTNNYGSPDGFRVSVSAAAVPEPGSVGLMLAGLGLVGVVRRKRAARSL